MFRCMKCSGLPKRIYAISTYNRLVIPMEHIYTRLIANLDRLTNEQLERLMHRCKAELLFRDAVIFDEPICDYSVLACPAWICAEWEIIRLHDRTQVH